MAPAPATVPWRWPREPSSTSFPPSREDERMSVWGRAKAKWDELLGRAEEVYGESHGDAAAELHGEAVRLEGEAEFEDELEEEFEEKQAAERAPGRRSNDDGLAGAR